MATQRAQKRLSTLKKSRKFRDLARQESRRLNLEQLEDRRVMATGPSLAALIPNGGVFLNNNDTLKVAPRELTFRFAEGQQIDGASILNGAGEADNGIRMVRSVNGIFGDADDLAVTPGFMGLADTPREVIMRFAENLPDDLYRVTIVGAGTTPLKDTGGNAANGGVDLLIDFNLDLGAKVQAIVPQPITRVGTTLTQNLKAIEVYYDHNELGASVTNPAFYRLINTAAGPNGPITLPQSVTYDPALRKATLIFANDIPVGTFRLDVGVTDESNEITSQAVHLGNSMASVYQAFLGDNTVLPAAQQSRDVDLYRFELRTNGALTVNLTPSAALDGVIRIFDSTGAQVGAVVNGGGAGATEVITTGALTAGTYYVGISSAGNVAYNPVSGAGATDGTSTGAYSFRATFSDLPALSDVNSSYASATPLGVLGLAGRLFTASIAPQPYNIPFPGLGDDPGHREVPYEDHLLGGGGGTAVIPYNFQDIYGFTPQGNPFFNAITENQKQRAREVFELYGRYLGVQFFETPNSGFIIATGDPRAVDPTIPPLGVGGIAGGNVAVMNAGINWGNSEYGSGWFTTAMHEIGHLLGLGHAYDLPNLTIQGGAETPGLSANPAEPVFPGDHDILHGQTLFRPQSRDIDLYQFSVTETGVLRAETIAERLGVASNQLNTVLTLYKETNTGTLKREIISRNDDYYTSDSYLELRLEPGVYYIAVTAAGNIEIDPNIPDSGFGGRSTGSYDLKMEFTPAGGTSLADTTGVKFDGDADGREGGAYSFWFQSGNTIFVDKARDITPAVDGNGTLASPFDTLSAALSAADAFAQANPGVPSLVRIVGNGGTDGNVLTLADNKAYLIGFKDQDAILDEPLADGADFLVPHNVTVMIDAGANFKLRKANMDAGSSAQGVDRSGGAIQVLGTPFVPVRYTSYHDDSIGGNSDGPLPGAAPGDWGGIVYRDDSDIEQRGSSEVQLLTLNGTSGTVRLSFNGVSGSLATAFANLSTTTAAQVQAHLSTIPALNGNIAVTGSPGGPFTISFIGALAGRDVSQLQSSVIASDPTTATTTEGGVIVSNEVQTLTLNNTGNASTMEFNGVAGSGATFFFDGPATTAAQVLANLNSIPALAGNVTVTGNLGGPFTITFINALAGTNVSQLVALSLPINLTVTTTADGSAPVTPANEVQSLSLVGSGAPIILSFNGVDGSVATSFVDAATTTAAQVLAHLNSIPALTGNVSVTGIAGGPFTITFINALALTNVSQIQAVAAPTEPPVSTVTGGGGASIFLNYVNNTFLQYGGGRVLVDSIESVYTPVHLVAARPAISYNTIIQSADAALSGDPNSFDDDGYSPNIAFKNRRIGPDIHDNTLSVATPTGVLANTVNGMFVRIRSLAGNPIDRLDVTARFDDTDIVHVIAENLLISGTPGGSTSPGADRDPTLQFDARLQIDPGMIVKLSGSRIEAKIGSQFIAEGSLEQPIIFTSLKDDKYGGSGTFDTNRDGSASGPAAGQWGGLVFSANSSANLDFAHIFYGGGTVPIEGGFDRFNSIEIHQADVRIANSLLQFNSDGGSATDRNGRGPSFSSTIMVTGAQPVIVNNIVRDNTGPVISINANSMQDTVLADLGRTTGLVADFNPANDNLASENRGPFVRGNRMVSNAINGMEVRGAVLTTETVWDDTDIAHILRGEIVVLNQHVYNGLRLQSRPNESLVVKLAGAAAGFTAGGVPLDIDDRIGGTVHIVGQPGRPVVLTDLADDTVPAGFQPDGLPLFDTNNNGASTGTAGAWRSIRLDKNSNDFNASIQLERENAQVGNGDANRTPQTAQVLGALAPNEKAGDDIRRLAYEIDGTIAYDRPNDVDVYSFTADSGTEVWIDLDRTSFGLDAMVELVDANGNVIARATDTDPLGRTPPLDTPPNTVGLSGSALTYNKDPYLGRDFYTTNPHDGIMRVILPGTNLKNIPYFVRVRSQPATFTGESGNTLNAGLTSGHYQLQVRLRQPDVKPGSTVRFADIRFATNAVEVLGLPNHSPLTSESEEANDGANNAQGGAQQLGNLLTSDKNTLSVGGFIGTVGDVDFYQFDLNVDLIQVIGGSSDGGKTWATIFDIDYADGITRPDTIISVFDQNGRLILVSRDGDIEDDQPAAGQGADTDDLSRGSFGKLDPYIGSVQLPAGLVGTAASRTYYVAVSTNRRLPSTLDQTFNQNATAPGVRMEPIDAIQRIVTDHFDVTGGETGTLPDSRLIDPTNLRSVGANVRPFSLGDVPLFVTAGDRLYNVDPAIGLQEVNVGNDRTGATQSVSDIAMRTDGVLFGYESVFANIANTAGRLTTIDAGTGAATTVSNDNIPDIPNPPPNPLDPQQVNTTTVGALAWGGTPVNGIQNSLLFYAVHDFASGASRLYRANPETGTANVVQGQPWGRVGGLTSFITQGNQANGSTDFNLGGPLLLDVRAIAVGPAGNGITINFTHANLGPGQPPRFNPPPPFPGTPPTITVELNIASATAQATTNFNTGGAVNVQFAANAPGAAGNNIALTFIKSDLGPGAPPAIQVIGSVIQVTLNTNPANPTTAAGLITALQNNVQANALINATVTTGNPATNISNTQINFSPLSLQGGADPTTAAQVAQLLNTTGIVTASVPLGANPNTPVSFGQAIAPVVLTTGAGGSGFTTGLAFGNDGQLYGVTDRGLFQRQIGTAGNARPQSEVSVTLPGVATPVFAGLARGPQNVENGRFANLLFAVTEDGFLCALNTQGVPQTIFDTNADGVADSVVISLSTGDFFTGLAFSPMDFNLWHPTFRRDTDTDHDIGPSPTLNAARGNAVNNMSFYFGYEQFQNNPGPTTDSYQTYAGFDNLLANNGQLGILQANYQQRLSTNAALNNTYNMPGGAYGSLITDSFSLASLKNTDKPTFYFDYFLDTDDVNANNGNMRDSARVYLTTDNGLTWDLVATNNSILDNPATVGIEGELPTFISGNHTENPLNPRQQVQLLHDSSGSWRQARIDLSRYAGLDGLKLRFDFTTAGEIANPDGSDPSTTVTPIRGVKENLFENAFGNFNHPTRGQANQFEGFYVDNFIIGPTERGEMVINSPANSNFFATPVPQNLNPLNPVPTEVLAGPYQLEIRRGAETGANLNGLTADIGLFPSLDTNERLVEDTRFSTAIPFEGFESGGLNTLPWNTRDDAPWTVTNAQAATGAFSAASGTITHGQTSGLEVALVTGPGTVSFAVSTSSQTGGDTFRFYIDGILTGQLSGINGFQTFSFPVSAGRHHFRWSYEKDASISVGLDRVFIDNVTFTTPQRGMGGIGDQNLTRDQGQILIEQNSIFAPSQVGILVDAGGRDTPDGSRTYPGGVRNLPTLNNELLAPGTTLTNNVVANFGQVGIRFSGDGNPVNSAEAATPFGRIVNNTVYGGATANGIGIEVIDNAGPTLLNNILSNSVTGILVDGSSTATTVIGENLYSGNTANGPLGTEPIVLPPGSPLFVDPANRNFYLVSGSPAIDSSINTLVDRESIKAVKSDVGIPESPILAPDRDVFGQLRIDDPSQDPPPGLGANIFKDRGAVERADFGGPTAQLIDPLDNDGASRDRNPNLTEVIIRNEILTRFTVKLLDLATGIDDLTVDASKFTLTKDGVAMVLGTDYTFLFNSNSDEVTFLPVSGQWENEKTYVILIDNSPTTGIRDLAANPIQPNQTDGTTKFTIFVGTVRDFGDAPSPYPSSQTAGGAAHDVTIGYFLGAGVDEESDAKITPPGDNFDDGVSNFLLSPTNASSVDVIASGVGVLDAWIDLNKDGDWADVGEYVIQGRALSNPGVTTSVPFTFGSATTPFGQTWARFRFTSAGINTPLGVAPDGEVEDYQVTLTGPPFQNPTLAPDVDNDGGVDTIDLLIVINFLTFLQSQLAPGNIIMTLPPTSPPYVDPAPTFDPTGGGVPGEARYVDVSPNGLGQFGTLDILDVKAIIDYLTINFIPGGGEGEGGEGEGFAAAPAAMAAASGSSANSASSSSAGSSLVGSTDNGGDSAAILAPATLYVSPSIVVEVRDVGEPATSGEESWLPTSGDNALELVAASTAVDHRTVGRLFSLEEYTRRTPAGPLDSETWEDLLADLSLDVGGLPGDSDDPA